MSSSTHESLPTNTLDSAPCSHVECGHPWYEHHNTCAPDFITNCTIPGCDCEAYVVNPQQGVNPVAGHDSDGGLTPPDIDDNVLGDSPLPTVDTSTYCAYCQLALDSWDTRVCSACGNIFCNQTCYNHHNVTGYHYGDDWYDDGVTRRLLAPHDHSYMLVQWSNNRWVPSLEPEEDGL